MSKNLVEIRLLAKDFAGSVIQTVARNIKKEIQETAKTTEKATQQGVNAVKKGAKEAEQAFKQSQQHQQTEAKKTAEQQVQSAKRAGDSIVSRYNKAKQSVASIQQAIEAREALGIRSEKAIQRQIEITRKHYENLKRSGIASARDLARAEEQLKNKVRELNAEMGKTEQLSKLDKAKMAGKAVAGVVAGSIAAKAVLTPALNDYKQWDANLTDVSMQAFGDKDANFIKGEGKEQIQAVVYDTVKNVKGATHDQALQTLNAMMVNGMSFEQAKQALPEAQRMQIAGKGSSEEIGALIKALSDYGFKGQDLTTAFEHALRSGMDGKFEIKDMVASLPELIPAAKSNGFNNLQHFDYLLAWLQSAADKAGSNSEAANNVINTLNKMTASDTTKRFAKEIENPFHKGKTIHLEQSILEGIKQGKTAVEVINEIANGLLKQDKQYQTIQAKLAKTTDAKEKQVLQSQLDTKKGFVLSLMLPDVQAKAGLYAYTDQEAMQARLKNTQEGSLTQGLSNKAVEVYGSTLLAKEAQAQSLAFLGQALPKNLAAAGGSLTDFKLDLAQNHPELFSFLSDTELAMKAVAAAAGVAATALFALGGERFNPRDWLRRSPSVTSTVSSGVGATVSAGANTASRFTQGLGKASNILGQSAKAIGALGGVYGVASTAQWIGEQQPKQQAYFEAKEEERSTAKTQLGRAMANQTHTTMGFQPAPFALTQSPKGVALYGGYQLAAYQQDNAVAQARLEQGTLSRADYEARLARNQARLQAVSSQQDFAKPEGQGLLKRMANFSSLQTSQIGLGQQVEAVSGTLAQYQADFQAFGSQIAEGLTQAVSGVETTLRNEITVQLDGRVVAEQTFEQGVMMFKRGVA